MTRVANADEENFMLKLYARYLPNYVIMAFEKMFQVELVFDVVCAHTY